MARLELLGRTAAVTGGARGIGRAIAELLGSEGATVFVLDIRPLEGEHHENLIYMPCDVSKDATVGALAGTIKERAQRVDILVNNAAAPLGSRKRLVDTPVEDWLKTIDLNLTSVFTVCRHFIPLMSGRTSSIINMASVFAHVGFANAAAYSATKGGILSMTRTLALEHAVDGIRVNSISPGTIGTERLVEQIGTLDEVSEKMSPLHPVGRIGTPSEVAEAALFLASDRSSFLTGTDIKVDGGFTAR